MNEQPTNADRAKRFAKLLRYYDADNADSGCLIDLLADARHWCDWREKCYGDLDRVAHDHYLVELLENRRGD